MRSSVERRKLQRCVSCYIKSSINLFTSFAEGNVLDVATWMQCLSEKNLQSSQVNGPLQNAINKFIIRKLNPFAVVDFRFISTFLHAWWALNSHAIQLRNFYQLSFPEMSSKRLHFTLSLHFTPGPQSAVCSPQSAFYTDRFHKR